MEAQDQHNGPQLFESAPLLERPGRPVGRVISHPLEDPGAPAFFEWQLTAEEWSDEHPHDEYVFVLDGELHVSAGAGASTVVAGPGAMVRVPAGSRGTYAAPTHARMLSIYGPRPGAVADARGILRTLT